MAMTKEASQFIDAVIADASKNAEEKLAEYQSIDGYIERNPHMASVQALSEELRKHARVCIGGRWGEDVAATGRSKIGGAPDLPAGFVWPTEDGKPYTEFDWLTNKDKPLTFVAQIDLEETSLIDPFGQLPQTGMLWLFSLGADVKSYAYHVKGITVAHFDSGAGQLTATKSPDPDATVLPEHGLAFGPTLMFDYIDEKDSAVRKKRYDSSIERIIEAAIHKNNGCDGQLRMLGNAYFFRQEISNNYNPGPDQLLVEINGYDLSTKVYGEGQLHWIIKKDALKKPQFKQVELLFEPGT